jgi:hypothetical protein
LVFPCCCFGFSKAITIKYRQFIYDLSMVCLGFDNFLVCYKTSYNVATPRLNI